MNEVFEVIQTRRSVRFYDSKPIPREIMEALIQAGNHAPSGSNTQPWRFVVVESERLRKKLAELALPRYQKWLENSSEQFKTLRKEIDSQLKDPVYYSAPVIIFVIGKKGMTSDFDCSLACQNIMLAARSLGIGSCWVFFGQLVLDDQEIRNTLELQEGEKVYGPLVLGYPQGDFPAMPAKKPPKIQWL